METQIEEKVWRMGEVHPDTNKVFWSYKDKAHTKEIWYTKERFTERKSKHNDYLKSDKRKQYDKQRYLDNPEHIKSLAKGNWQRLIKEPFRLMLYSIKSGARNRKLECNLTVEDLRTLWENQQGKCYYSGLDLNYTWRESSPYQMSADRLDSSKGYYIDNVVLCCQSLNFAKSDYPVEIFKEFLDKIKNANN